MESNISEMKSELLDNFLEDFNKTQGALSEIIENNRAIDSKIVEDLIEGTYNQLEEHIEISKLIMEGVKGFNELYKNAPSILEKFQKLKGEEKPKSKISLSELMKDEEES